MVESATDLLILDEQHLKRQTMSDPDLEVEILSLFITEAERLMSQIEQTQNAAKRLERFHAVKGLASNVGAKKLAGIMASLKTGDAGDVAHARAAVDQVIAYIRTSDGRVSPLQAD